MPTTTDKTVNSFVGPNVSTFDSVETPAKKPKKSVLNFISRIKRRTPKKPTAELPKKSKNSILNFFTSIKKKLVDINKKIANYINKNVVKPNKRIPVIISEAVEIRKEKKDLDKQRSEFYKLLGNLGREDLQLYKPEINEIRRLFAVVDQKISQEKKTLGSMKARESIKQLKTKNIDLRQDSQDYTNAAALKINDLFKTIGKSVLPKEKEQQALSSNLPETSLSNSYKENSINASTSSEIQKTSNENQDLAHQVRIKRTPSIEELEKKTKELNDSKNRLKFS